MVEARRRSERHGDGFAGLGVILQIWRPEVILAGLMAPLHPLPRLTLFKIVFNPGTYCHTNPDLVGIKTGFNRISNTL